MNQVILTYPFLVIRKFGGNYRERKIPFSELWAVPVTGLHVLIQVGFNVFIFPER